jgi:hypothetical protein
MYVRSTLTELQFHRGLALGVIATGAATFVLLFRITAPYGRHVRTGWGPSIPNRWGWLLMESPAVLAFSAIYFAGAHAAQPVPLAFATLWLTHYCYRSFVYPWRLREATKPMPLVIALMGVVFNIINAYLNARWLSELGSYPLSCALEPQRWLGVAAFVVGLSINVQSDNILLRLRSPGERTYKIPRGGAFRWVSAPNYAAELLEWGGWALATWSLAGASFFLFTFANLVPRAVAHHEWYRRTFPDYPDTRRAIIPFVW